MYCKKCGFITKGKEKKCPYCGNIYSDMSYIDQKKVYFNWLEISPRQIINICLINIFFLLIIIDAILFANSKVNYHITPWTFIVIFSILIIFNSFVPLNRKRFNYLFLKSVFFLIFSGIFLMYSYAGGNFLKAEVTHNVFGYYYPIGMMVIVFLGIIKVFAQQKYNMLSTFFYVLISVIFSTVLFILTMTNSFGLAADTTTNIINIISFAFVLLISFNNLIFSYLRIKSKFSIRG